MQEINIYKSSQDNFPKIFTKLVESIITQNKRIHILCTNSEEEEKLDFLLWSYNQLSFLPHGTSNDPYCEEQLALLTSDPYTVPQNNPGILLIIDYQKFCQDKDIAQFWIKQYQKFLVFDISETKYYESQVQLSGLLFQQAISLEIPINFVEQNSDGKWVKHVITQSG